MAKFKNITVELHEKINNKLSIYNIKSNNSIVWRVTGNQSVLMLWDTLNQNNYDFSLSDIRIISSTIN